MRMWIAFLNGSTIGPKPKSKEKAGIAQLAAVLDSRRPVAHSPGKVSALSAHPGADL